MLLKQPSTSPLIITLIFVTTCFNRSIQDVTGRDVIYRDVINIYVTEGGLAMTSSAVTSLIYDIIILNKLA